MQIDRHSLRFGALQNRPEELVVETPALAWPKVNSRKKTANVDGAYTSSNTRGVPPARRHVDVVDAARTSSRR
jgi:hypothetical protein